MEEQNGDKGSLLRSTYHYIASSYHGEVAKEGQAFKENFLQQDGVKNHISEDDKMFNDALMEKGINAKLYKSSKLT